MKDDPGDLQVAWGFADPMDELL